MVMNMSADDVGSVLAERLEEAVQAALTDFCRRRLDGLKSLKLKDVLARKNPYLFRATGVQEAAEIVKELLAAHVSSSDEGIFGDAFFEPIARIFSNGTVAGSKGVDVIVETDDTYKAIAVKSGPNIFNSSQAARQDDEFRELRQRLSKMHKKFDPIVAACYGRVPAKSKAKHNYRRVAGQQFWHELTGDPDFYLKLMSLMKDYPQQHRLEFQLEWSNAVNRFTQEFLNDFSSTGAIDWEKLLRFNSGVEAPPRPGRKTNVEQI